MSLFDTTSSLRAADATALRWETTIACLILWGPLQATLVCCLVVCVILFGKVGCVRHKSRGPWPGLLIDLTAACDGASQIAHLSAVHQLQLCSRALQRALRQYRMLLLEHLFELEACPSAAALHGVGRVRRGMAGEDA